MAKRAKDLKPNPDNPRQITDEKLFQFKRALEEFGDLSGIVFNRVTGQLVGGHQRAKLIDSSTPIELKKTYKKPTKTGTVAEGLIVIQGENHTYREVAWDTIKEKAANLAANRGAGEWNELKLGEWLKDIEDIGFDLDLTLFDENERAQFEVFKELVNPKPKKKPKVKFEAQRSITCPKCRCIFAVDAG